MRALVVYDSKYGNTELVARAIALGLGKDAKAVRVGDVGVAETLEVELIVLGCPVYGGKPSKPMREFLNVLAPTRAHRFATFDTRMTTKMAENFGYAAPRMADSIRDLGNTLVGEPTGFIVAAQKGPLAEGELDRATAWGRSLAKLP